MSNGIFAGIGVRDFDVSLRWYQQLLGRAPSFFPNDVEAVWQLAENCHLYIIRDQQRAGGAVHMLWVDDVATEIEGIVERGLDPDDVEKHDPVWKYVFHDPDGNEIGVGGEVTGTGDKP